MLEASASAFLQNQQLRHHPIVTVSSWTSGTGGLGAADPDSGILHNAALGGLMEVWRLLPNLKDLPEAILQKLSPEAVLQLNNALGKDIKSAAKLTVNARLSQNAKKLLPNPTRIEDALDNRRDVLHPARFLGGSTCSTTELWLAARQFLGDKGLVALGNYDLDTLGCGGCVTPKGWEALHNPSSQELKIKMFYLPNVANSSFTAKRVNLADGDEALSIGDNMKEIADDEGFKAALNTAREAMHTVMPWNCSISALVGFMTNTNYLQEDLRNNVKRATILSEFTDYVFGRNALNWENGHPFLYSDELGHAWAQWKGKRIALFSGRYGDRPTAKPKRSDICRRYNGGDCPKQAEKECKSFLGTTLRHVCNKFIARDKQCEKPHPRSEHK